MKTIKTLIIIDYIPEKTVKILVDLTAEEYNYFSKCHGYIVNASEHLEEKCNIFQTLDAAICTDLSCLVYYDEEKAKEYFGKFVKFILQYEETNIAGVEKLISTGLCL